MSSDALLTSPRLIVFAGVPGAGKSAIVRLVAERRCAAYLRVGSVDAALLRAVFLRSFDTGLAAYLAAQASARAHGGQVIARAVRS